MATTLAKGVPDHQTLTIQSPDHTKNESRDGVLERKSRLGQFMTRSTVARFMAYLFPPSTLETCRLLDAGAGAGALSCAFLDRWTSGHGFNFQNAEIEAYEIDDTLRQQLGGAFANYARSFPVKHRICPKDFIIDAALRSLGGGRYTHAILNPPYKKINSASEHRLILRQAGIETGNLYSAFVSLALALMEPGGQLVAIIPRSFCNGPYYRPFREFLLRRAALRHIHLFGSRAEAFKDDDVLQENVIIMLERGGHQYDVTVSNSTDDQFADLTTHIHPFERIVFPGDPEKFIYVPESNEHSDLELSRAVRFSLEDIGVDISTGPVVDFRLKNHIRQIPASGTVPLLYAGHFSAHRTYWPRQGIKRGNAIERSAQTEKWLFPIGFYTVVRRFSAKEERRRIVASVVSPDTFPGAKMLGFENHLNVFHERKKGLAESVAHGLAAFLNTTAVDTHFRRFNGHTQVNATDLRLMKYPSRAVLTELGDWAASQQRLTQDMLDDQLKNFR